MLLAMKQLTNILLNGYTQRDDKKGGKTMHGKTTYNIRMVTTFVVLQQIGRNEPP